MTKSEALTLLSQLFEKFLSVREKDKIIVIKEQVLTFFDSLPFAESDTEGKNLIIEVLKYDMESYINSDFNERFKYQLSGDFQNALMHVSLSLLK